VLALSVIWGWGLKVNFMAKHTLFKFPQGLFFKSVGGIPVDRRSAQGLVGRLTEEFTRRKQLILGIAPEGSRNTDGSLKEGFARIAQAASIPVLPAIINHKQRTIRIGEVIKDVSDVGDVIASVKQQALTGARKAPFKP
jgi:1-acyl-sn-glycerol-3-phosphate acyltransferase